MTSTRIKTDVAHNREESLLCSPADSEEIISCPRPEQEIQCLRSGRGKQKYLGASYCLVGAILSIILAVCSIIWKPFLVMMNERLNMRPGLPSYDWWVDPPDEVLIRMYVFNVTNSERFLNGSDPKLEFQEIGPIIFREKLQHSNVTFNENGTMTYTAKRTAIFLPELNDIDLNATIITPNIVTLGMASYFYDSSLFTKIGLNIMMENQNSDPIVSMTLYNYLWNFTDPLLDMGQSYLPVLVPVDNVGILATIYSNFEDVVNTYIGPRYGHERFMLIEKYHGSEYQPGYDKTCKKKITGSSEGVVYPQYLNKTTKIKYWRKTICQVADLEYSVENRKYGINAYRFDLRNDTYDRTFPAKSDCFKGTPILVNGLVDISKCYFNFPVATSFPHFLHGDESLRTGVLGLKPDALKHGSYALIEPITGVPLESKARSQSNLVMREFDGFGRNIDRFSKMTIPMFWAEYSQEGLPWYIVVLVYFTVNIIPWSQWVGTGFFFTLSVYLLVRFLMKTLKKETHILMNKTLHFEKQRFLEKV